MSPISIYVNKGNIIIINVKLNPLSFASWNSKVSIAFRIPLEEGNFSGTFCLYSFISTDLGHTSFVTVFSYYIVGRYVI